METCLVTKKSMQGGKITVLLYIANGPGDKGISIGEDVTYTSGVAFCICDRLRERTPRAAPVQWA